MALHILSANISFFLMSDQGVLSMLPYLRPRQCFLINWYSEDAVGGCGREGIILYFLKLERIVG